MFEIQFISDSRFSGSKKNLVAMDKKLKKTGIEIVSQGSIRTVCFPKTKDEEKSCSWRKKYIVNKGKNKTWKEAMTKVNKIQAPFYKRIK